jgi:hypothetical protein
MHAHSLESLIGNGKDKGEKSFFGKMGRKVGGFRLLK